MSVKPNRPLYQLPLHLILKNNVALSYLLDFMSAIGSQAYLFFLLNAEGSLTFSLTPLKLSSLKAFYLNRLESSGRAANFEYGIRRIPRSRRIQIFKEVKFE